MYHTSTKTQESIPLPLAIDRLRDTLRQLAADAAHTLIEIGHRALAQLVGVSASRICQLMQRLEAAGEIARVPYKNRYQIDVGPLIDQTDRSAPAPLIDQSFTPDRSGVNAHPAETTAPHPNAANETATRNRVKNACMVDHDLDQESDQEEESRGPLLLARLLAEPGMNAELARRIVAQRLGTLAEFEQDVQLAAQMADVRLPFYLTAKRWASGQRVELPEETPHATRQVDVSTHHARRSAARPPARRQLPVYDPAAIAARITPARRDW